MWCCWGSWLYVLVSIVAAALVGIAFYFREVVPSWSIKQKNVIITGGSSGIGLATAIMLAKQGASNITIIARDQKRIDEAVPLIKKANSATTVHSISADVSERVPVQAACEKAVQLMGGRLDAVILSAGASHPGLFVATEEEEFERLIKINYTGIVYTLKTCVPHLIRSAAKSKDGARIMIVSSMAGLSGIAGFTAYSGSKFALRGLAESLHMELSPTCNVSVSLCNPPDVNTPMLARENLIKPKECRLISEGSGTFEAEHIAGDMVEALKNWKFLVNTGMDGHLLSLIASGTSPAHSGVWGVIELAACGILRIVSLVYRWHYNRVVKQVHVERVAGSLKDNAGLAYQAILTAKK